MLQPLQVKAYVRLHLRRAKNDALDAALIAAPAAAISTEPSPPDPRLAPLVDLLTFVEQIEDDLARLQTRLEHIDDPQTAPPGERGPQAARGAPHRRAAAHHVCQQVLP